MSANDNVRKRTNGTPSTMPTTGDYDGTNSSGTSTPSNSNFDTHSVAQREFQRQQLRDKAVKLKHDLLENFETNFESTFEEYIRDMDEVQTHITTTAMPFKDKYQLKKGELPEKIFVPRNSVLTELFEISHIRTIYHIFVAILIIFSLNTIMFDIVEQGRIVLEFENMFWAFGKFPLVMYMWGCMMLSTTLVVYPLFKYWAETRQPGPLYWLDWTFLAIYISYQLIFLIWPIQEVFHAQLPPASATVICCEQTRLLMKSHAFVRENIPRALGQKKDDAEGPLCPGFSRYLYFLFAPTLVYRDEYPRTGTIRWNYVCSNFLQVLGCLFYLYYIFERFCVPVFQNFNKESLSVRRLLLSSFSSMMPGTLVLFIGFFAILHSWLNAFAEMLRFADRLFYKDWWNSSTFASYYRTWNVVVHDWLYSYVYKDCYKLFRSNKPAAMLSVFLLSAVFHEYIISTSLGFVYPVLFVMFAGAGFILTFVPSRHARTGNVFMWVGLFFGDGVLLCLYSMEFFARRRCPVHEDSSLDVWIPRSWTCNFTGIIT